MFTFGLGLSFGDISSSELIGLEFDIGELAALDVLIGIGGRSRDSINL